jgi:signal transduction histidine kinase
VKNILLFLIFLNFHLFGEAQKFTKADILATDTFSNAQKAIDVLKVQHKFTKEKSTLRLLVLQKLTLRTLETVEYDALTKFCQEGIELAKKQKNDSLTAYFYKYLGISQVYTNKPEKAIETWKKCADIARIGQEPYIEATCYNNIGGTLIDLNKMDEAEKYLIQSIQLSEKNGTISLRNKLLSYRLLATLYDRTNRKKQAGQLYEKVQLAAYELKDTNLICSNLVFHANYLKELGDIEAALSKSKEALEMIQEYGDQNSIMTALQFHANILSKKGRYKEAYEHYAQFVGMHKSIYKAETQRQLNELETKYKTKEIAESKKLSDANALIEKRQKENYLFLLSISIIFIFLLILSFLYRQQKLKLINEKRVQNERFSALLEGQEEERERIAKELHDGIVQDLTVLKLDLKRENNAEHILSQVDTISKELRELSYQMMPVALRELGLIAALEQLFQRSLTQNGIGFEFEHFNYEQRLSEKIEVSVYRICQELLNNVLKHSKANRVHVVLRKNTTHLSLLFEDNGKGFDAENSSKGIGLNSLSSRVEFLKGNLEIDSNKEKGTTAYIRIPIG